MSDTTKPPGDEEFPEHFVQRDEDFSHHLQYDGVEVPNPPRFDQNFNARDGRTLYGVPWPEIVQRARYWWNMKGRKIAADMTDQRLDLGPSDPLRRSAILRGEPFENLSERELSRVLDHYEREHVRPEHKEEILAWMMKHNPNSLDPERLSVYHSYEESLRLANEALVNPTAERVPQ